MCSSGSLDISRSHDRGLAIGNDLLLTSRQKETIHLLAILKVPKGLAISHFTYYCLSCASYHYIFGCFSIVLFLSRTSSFIVHHPMAMAG